MISDQESSGYEPDGRFGWLRTHNYFGEHYRQQPEWEESRPQVLEDAGRERATMLCGHSVPTLNTAQFLSPDPLVHGFRRTFLREEAPKALSTAIGGKEAA